jgi:hypothetical protein
MFHSTPLLILKSSSYNHTFCLYCNRDFQHRFVWYRHQHRPVRSAQESSSFSILSGNIIIFLTITLSRVFQDSPRIWAHSAELPELINNRIGSRSQLLDPIVLPLKPVIMVLEVLHKSGLVEGTAEGQCSYCPGHHL